MKPKSVLAWMPAVIFMAVLFYLSSLPGDALKVPAFPMSDKVAHFLAYGFLGWLISFRVQLDGRAKLSQGFGFDGRGQWIGMLYGISDEIHQIFVPMRESSILDWTADALGVAAGSWICRIMIKKFWAK